MPIATRHRCTGSPVCPAMVPAGVRYCPDHQAAYEARRGTRRERGYDAAHDALRAQIVRRMRVGETIRCVTCDVALTPATLDLGHTEDRTAHIGPQCAACNRSDGGRRGARATNRR